MIMNTRTRRLFPFLAKPILSAAAALLVPCLHAQQAPPEAPTAPGAQAAVTPDAAFAFEIGHAAKAGTVYSVYATQPATSKLTGQKIRLKFVEILGNNRTTHYFTMATGRHKTVADIDAILTNIFRRFVSEPVTVNQELGKIGDLSQGGEIRFVTESADTLRFDNFRPNAPVASSHYRRADIEAFLAALTGVPSA